MCECSNMGNSSIPSILMCYVGIEEVSGAEGEVNWETESNKKDAVIINKSQPTSHRCAGQGTSERSPLTCHAHVRMFDYGNSPIPSILMCCIGIEDVTGADDEVDGDPNPSKKDTVIVNDSQPTSHPGGEQGTSEHRLLTFNAHV